MANSDNPSDSQGKTRNLRVVMPPEFLARAIRGAKGSLVTDVHNATLFLEGCPDLPDAFYFQFDEMQQAVVTGKDLHPLTDFDVIDCLRWFEQQAFKKIPERIVRAAILLAADGRRFNPLIETLNSLVWDRVPRLETWLHDFLGTPDDNYHAVVGTMFMRQMIARTKEPGCKADYMLILEGPQRTLKSTVCEVLSLGYFSDNLPDLAGDPVRISMHLRGKLVIEISELSAFSRAEQSRLKQFLSSHTEKYTPKYGRCEVEEPRRCVFIGTTNKTTYLRDETGGARFWPVKVGKVLIQELRNLVLQLFAEAWWDVSVCQKPWWPPPDFEEKVIGPQQDARYQGDAWEQPIAQWDRQTNDTVDGHTYRTPLDPPYYLAQIADGALGIKPGMLRKAEEMRLAATLEFMGWTRAKRTMRGIPWWPPKPM